MSIRKAKTSAKMFISDKKKLQKLVLETMKDVADAVGSSLGTGGKNTLIESDMPGIQNSSTKDGVTIYKSLGYENPYKHAIVEQSRDAAIRTANEAGDGPQPLYSKVLTPNGFIEMKDITLGMDICGTNNTIQKVLGIFPKGQKEIYKVVLSDGREVECCQDHLWEVTTNYGTKKVITTETMSKDFSHTQSDGSIKYKYYLPITKTEFNNKNEMILDPYLLGVLLGDGSLSDSGSIELSLGYNKKHIIDKLVLPVGVYKSVQIVENRNSYRIKLHGVRHIIKTLGLDNTNSFNKFIPKEYLYSSVETRERLLQGLLDTDGYVNNRGLFEFSTVSDSLMNDFIFLIRSLGKSSYHTLHSRNNDMDSYSNNPIHRITELKGYKYGDKVVDIVKTGKFTEMQCIKVSNPDNLYITDNFVVTHNTTTATVLSYAIIKNLFDFCEKHPRYSPQKAVRKINKAVNEILIPYIKSRSVLIGEDNKDLLKMVATISANGDSDMADAVLEAFEAIGFGDASHVTIRESSGKEGYKVERIDGFPLPIGYEESIGKLHTAFINDQAGQRCFLEKPLYLLFDGMVNDLMGFLPLLDTLGKKYVEDGDSDFKNLVLIAHGFSENVLTQLAFNFSNPNTLNVLPVITPLAQFHNSQLQFLMDVSAFTGAKLFGLKDQISSATLNDLGLGSESFECNRFRSTIIGDPEPFNVEVRADELRKMMENPESLAEKGWLEERIAKITNGIAKLTVFGGSNGAIKEKKDRVDDAVCAVRSAIREGAVPGGCRIPIDMALKLFDELPEGDPARDVLAPAFLSLPQRLLDNAGYNLEEANDIIGKLIEDPNKVYDTENEQFGDAIELGLFDATSASIQSLSNAVSIAGILGTMGCIVVYPRDSAFELAEARADSEFIKDVENPNRHVNEANERF